MTAKSKVLKFYADKHCRFCGSSMNRHDYPAQLCGEARTVFDNLSRSGVRGAAMRAAFTANIIREVNDATSTAK